jgi:hypothetical protein
MIVAQSAATARAYASRHRQTLDENTDLVGLAAANAAAVLSSTFVMPDTVTSQIGSNWKWSREIMRARCRDMGSTVPTGCASRRWICLSHYGSEAANLALKVLATGGIYLGGGIAPKMVDKLRGWSFLKAFSTKGRMSHLLKAIPVRVTLNDKAGLLGAVHCAALRA